jgi:hypothetical protein
MTSDKQRDVEQLAQHWLSEMVCDHPMKRDRAVCCCGFVTGWKPTVGDAAKAWAEHALNALRRQP